MVNDMKKISVLAPLSTEAAASAKVAKVLNLPPEEDRQIDLQYLTAIFVSSGMNRNGAVFLGSELVGARSTILNKAVDLEHDEQTLVGQITGSAFLKRDRTPMNVDKAAELSIEELDELDMDIAISAVIHKARFPEIADEILAGGWMVSMECFYSDFDVKVGDMIIPREQAQEMGFDKLVGSVIQLKDGKKELGFHLVGRVLRGITFAGVGIVKNPANPRSIIMEAASMDEYIQEQCATNDETPVIDLAILTEAASTPVVKAELRTLVEEVVQEAMTQNKEAAQNLQHVRPGTCVSYKRYIHVYPDPKLEDPENDITQYPLLSAPDSGGAEYPGAEVAREHWCSLFDLACTARPGDATLPDCWRNVFARTVNQEIDSHTEVLRRRRIEEGLVALQELIEDARKFRQ